MDIRNLKVFLSVYEEKSFSKASKVLNVSQPTVSEHLKNLEEELKVSLFDRLGRRIVPTRHGEELYPKALKVVRSFESLHEEIADMRDPVSGPLSVAASTIPGEYFLPRVIAEFCALFPEVSPRLLIKDSREVTDMLLSLEVPLGFVGAVMEKEKLKYIPVFKDQLILIGKGREGEGEMLDPGEVEKIPLVNREEGSGTRKTMERWMEASGVDPSRLCVVAEFGTTTAVVSAVKAGLGYSFVSKVAVEEEIRFGTIREIFISGFPVGERSFYMAVHRKRSLLNPYRAFFDHLKMGLPGKKEI